MMAIQPINNAKSKSVLLGKKDYVPYLQANEPIETPNNVKPLPGEGYLIHDNVGTSVKYFFKDIGYDIKSIKNGFNGTANDHQLGRLNDVGLKLGGLGIAAYLASKTTNPKARLMEYVGFGAFLGAMNLYPKLAINKPAEIVQGFEIDKQYVDDQGRKKSVFQDSNYIPYDLYTGTIADEDLDIIGDRMGIDRNEPNRHGLIKEQMRKIATQNNTLWMLTAGFATPTITALACSGLDSAISSGIEKYRSNKYNNLIEELHTQIGNLAEASNEQKTNSLTKEVEKVLKRYQSKGEELPAEEIKYLKQLFTEQVDVYAQKGILTDLDNLLSSTEINFTQELLEEVREKSKEVISGKGNARTLSEQYVLPSAEEFESAIKKVIPEVDLKNGGVRKSNSTIDLIVSELEKTLNKKLKSESLKDLSSAEFEYLEVQKSKILNKIKETFKANESTVLSEAKVKEISTFADIISDFRKYGNLLERSKAFKVEYAPETVIARSSEKFTKALVKNLDLSFKDLRLMKDSEEYTFNILKDRFAKLAKDPAKYENTLRDLSNVLVEMDAGLNGNESTNYLLKLINAHEDLYHKTAQRLHKLNSENYKHTIDMLVKQDINTLSHSIQTTDDLFKFLNGHLDFDITKAFNLNNKELWGSQSKLQEELISKVSSKDKWVYSFISEHYNDFPKEIKEGYIKYCSDGIGSSKNLSLLRIMERYQGSRNSFNRIIHAMEIFNRANSQEVFHANPKKAQLLLDKIIEAVLKATSSDFTLKLGTINNPILFREIMNGAYKMESVEGKVTERLGYATKQAKGALEEGVLRNFQLYINRFRNLVGNSGVDFTKPFHVLESSVTQHYAKTNRTRLSNFNLIAQHPVDMLKDTAERLFTTKLWTRRVLGVGVSTFVVTLLTQFTFGKVKRYKKPETDQKQVKNDAN